MTLEKPQRPIWLLDVDGVINTNRPTKAWPAEQWVTGHAVADYIHWPIAAAQPVLDFIACAHTRARANIFWHSTWNENISQLNAVLQLPELPTYSSLAEFRAYRRGRTYGQWWKIHGALHAVEQEKAPLLWTDDDTYDDLMLPPSARTRLTSAGPDVLIISPDPSSGLTTEDLETINRFLDQHDR